MSILKVLPLNDDKQERFLGLRKTHILLADGINHLGNIIGSKIP